MKRYRVKAPEIPARPVPHQGTERSLEDMFQDMENGYGREHRQEDHEDVEHQSENIEKEKDEVNLDVNSEDREGGEKRELEDAEREKHQQNELEWNTWRSTTPRSPS